MRESQKNRSPPTEETRTKIKLSKLGKPRSEEVKAKISASHLGKSLSPQHRKNISDANTGKTISEETRDKLRLINLGRRASKETRKKLSQARKGKDHPVSWYEKMIGRSVSYETKLKITEYLLGGFWYGNVRYPCSNKYCELFNYPFKERVRAYWGYRCAECGKPQSENGKRLEVHHVHYDRKMCCNGSPRDVVPLCKSCHASTNGERHRWELHFTKMLYSKSEPGKCFFTQIEMLDFLLHEKRELELVDSREVSEKAMGFLGGRK